MCRRYKLIQNKVRSNDRMIRFKNRPVIEDYLNGSRWLVDFKNRTDDLNGIEKI